MTAVPLIVRSPIAEPRPTLRLVPTGPDVSVTAARSAVRLTRRGRAAITLIVACAVLACTALALRAMVPAPSGPTSVVVESGQTLSQVAHAAFPTLPVGEAVTRMQLANSLNSLQVNAGQQLVIPR